MAEKKNSRIHEILAILKENDATHGMTPRKLCRILEQLGPTFIKLGQILSMRSDLIPAAYCDELAKLRTHAEAMPFPEVRQIIEEEYGIKSWKEVFSALDSQPVGSASIAQVHKAVLKNGKAVVVKVCRPGIRKTMGEDIAILRKAVGLVRFAPELGDPLDFRVVIEEMWAAAQQEMDFLMEASHLQEFAKLNADVAYVACPAVEKGLTTSRILVMEYVDGIPIDQREKLIALGYDMSEIAKKLAENYTKQVLDDGFFHADPHPGNILIRDGKIVWLDLGMVGKLSSRDREQFTAAIQAIAEGDIYELENIVLSIGVLRQKPDRSALYNDLELMVDRYGDMDFASLNLGQLMMEMIDVTNRNHIGLPQGVSMVGRGLVTLEGVLAEADPELNFIEIVKQHLAGRKPDLKKDLTAAAAAILAAFRKGLDVPVQLADLLKMAVKGQTRINLEITGSEEPLSRIDVMVNKLIMAVICAGLLVGSSLICTTDMQGRLFGIPALGAVGFLIAAVLGMIIVYDILRKK